MWFKPLFFHVIVHEKKFAIRAITSSALMPPRTFPCTAILRCPRSAALFVGWMFGFGTNRNRSLPALLILSMIFLVTDRLSILQQLR